MRCKKNNYNDTLLIFIIITVLMMSVLFTVCESEKQVSAGFKLPEITHQNKPWTYWWWMGSAVDSTNITKNLEEYYEAGIGGVHIIPIYGAKGYEDRYIAYMSPKWIEMLAFTVSEAKRLDMGVDMTTGTGWPFGGPQLGPEDAASKVRIETFEQKGGDHFTHSLEHKMPQALMAFSRSGELQNVLGEAHKEAGVLQWDVPRGEWTLYAVMQEGTGQQVKRAAPGGEGNVLDYFSLESLYRYLDRFDEAFKPYVGSLSVRAFYNDSYEVYGSNWTDDFLVEFIRLRKYGLNGFLPELLNKGDSDLAARIRHDYNETISDLLLEQFTIPWVNWSHGKGSITRSQSHGSPGNLLDLYAAADIPETEAFGSSGFPIPGLRIDPDMPEHFGKPDILVSKFASSAAHVTGKPLVSSESCTWLGEHFKVALSQIKPEIDALLVSGVNHVFFHGLAYSPKEAPWPGWLFYASTNFAQSNTFWIDLPELNAYIARCQSFLQSGKPANDILLYWPVHDIWRTETDEDGLHHFQVHNANIWLYGTPFFKAAQTMWSRGYTFDYVSDRMLEHIKVSPDGIVSGGNVYRAIVVPGCRYMPVQTLAELTRLAKNGATVIFTGSIPQDIPGLTNINNNRTRFAKLIEPIKQSKHLKEGIRKTIAGKGIYYLGDNLEDMLQEAGIQREQVVDNDVKFIRRTYDKGYHYFLTNLSSEKLDDWITLGVGASSVVLYDPLNQKHGRATVRKVSGGITQVYCCLEPGQSCILQTFDTELVSESEWEYISPAGEGIEIQGQWNVEFIEGGPKLPEGFTTERLASWTDLGDHDARIFGGTARYMVKFHKPSIHADNWRLDLGRVCESARVSLNGAYIGAVWCFPFSIVLGDALKDGENRLEIEVTNLAANRIKDMDSGKVEWKIFHDINFVSIKYNGFDASSWEFIDSG
ncbi:MAG: glycoside hydrolase, partial [Candidatus Latescibacteria bacterium]|nr:glycoside hydrolase [Candidatus Latescibacterota bacterium]